MTQASNDQLTSSGYISVHPAIAKEHLPTTVCPFFAEAWQQLLIKSKSVWWNRQRMGHCVSTCMPLYGAITYKPSIKKPLYQSFSLVLYTLFFFTLNSGECPTAMGQGRMTKSSLPSWSVAVQSSGGSITFWSTWDQYRSLHQTVQLPTDPHYDTDTDHFIRRFNYRLILIMTQIQITSSGGSTASSFSLWHRYRSLHQTVQPPPDPLYDTDHFHQMVQLPPDPHYDTDTDHFIRWFNNIIMTQITSWSVAFQSSGGSTASWSSLWHRYRSLHQVVQLPPDTHDTDTDHSFINSS